MIRKSFRFEGYYTILEFQRSEDGVITIKRHESVNPIMLKNANEAREIQFILADLTSTNGEEKELDS